MAYDLVKVARASNRIAQYRVSRFIFHPKHWARYGKRVPPLTWKTVAFSPASSTSVPDDKHGVYTFVLPIGAVSGHPACQSILYVGKAEDTSLRQRFYSYLHEKTKPKPRQHILDMVTLWKDFLTFNYAVIASGTTIGTIEDTLISAWIPPFNRRFPATLRKPLQRIFEPQ